MNMFKKSILLAGCVAALSLFVTNSAQAQRNFDPAAMRQERLDRMKDTLEVKDDKEWSAIQPLVGKVMDAQRDLMASRMRGMMGGRNRRSRGGDNGDNNGSSNRPSRSSFLGEPSAAVTDLQKAIDAKAPATELKSKMAAVRAETKDKEAKLDAAEEDLRSVLTTRQEAIAVENGLLK